MCIAERANLIQSGQPIDGPDSNHDAAFWQHCADETIDYYKTQLAKRGIKLKHVHIW